MYEITALNNMLMSELKEIAASLNIQTIDDLSKPDLITTILAAQPTNTAEPEKKKPRVKAEKTEKVEKLKKQWSTITVLWGITSTARTEYFDASDTNLRA